MGKKVGGLGHFDNLSGIHQRHPMRHLRDDRQIMGDEQHRHFLRLLQLPEQIKNLRLNRDIQRCGGFIGNHHIGLRSQRNGDHDTLFLPARHLKRVVVDTPLWLRNAHPLQPVHRLG